MWTRLVAHRRALYALRSSWASTASGSIAHPHGRGLLTLAIETSCDDTSVAVLETTDHDNGGVSAKLYFHEKVTANNDAYGGIHPIVALESHQRSLAPLIQKAISHLPAFSATSRLPTSTSVLWASPDGLLRKKPDFISATRGPGMRSNLSVGLNTAKGLSLAWAIPLVSVHHMQAHALTPRLLSTLESATEDHSTAKPPAPAFPFLSLLVSGGHTMLISSTGLTDHAVLAATGDIALGDCLDKAARMILPAEALFAPYGRAMEKFAFPDGAASYGYSPPRGREQELERRRTEWGWSFGPPLGESRGGRSARRMEYSFSGLLTAVQRVTGEVEGYRREASSISEEEGRGMAREVQRVAFEHLCGRLLLYLTSLSPAERGDIRTVVVSGGVAANHFLRHVFRSMLDVQGFGRVEVLFPPVQYCTDNAAMISWAGCEMWKAGWRSNLSIEPIRKWSLDPEAEDGGILGASGWAKA